ncbi:MAG: BTAD domain-containing putative transcriptional regulator [Actinomycetota bacterium]
MDEQVGERAAADGVRAIVDEGVGALLAACDLLRQPAGRQALEADSAVAIDELVEGLERLASIFVAPASPSTTHPRVRIQLLGEMRLWIDGRPVDGWRSRNGRAILARLAIARPHGVPFDELLADVWPDAPFDGARNRVHVAVHKLRRVLGRDGDRLVTFQNDRYVLAGPDLVDVDLDEVLRCLDRGRELVGAGDVEAAMAMLDAALAQPMGELCEGEHGAEWIDRHRRHVTWRLCDELHRLGDAARRHGELERADAAAQRALQLDPADEVAHRQLIQVHLAAGRTDLAREQFRRCARVMQSELGLAPLAETSALLDEAS